MLNWFKSYLNNRKQCTSLLTYMSDLESVKYGVPQGSVLGPLLFLIYVNDIQYVVKDSKIKLSVDCLVRQYDLKRLLLLYSLFLCVLCFTLIVKRCVCQCLIKNYLI